MTVALQTWVSLTFAVLKVLCYHVLAFFSCFPARTCCELELVEMQLDRCSCCCANFSNKFADVLFVF